VTDETRPRHRADIGSLIRERATAVKVREPDWDDVLDRAAARGGRALESSRAFPVAVSILAAVALVLGALLVGGRRTVLPAGMRSTGPKVFPVGTRIPLDPGRVLYVLSMTRFPTFTELWTVEVPAPSVACASPAPVEVGAEQDGEDRPVKPMECEPPPSPLVYLRTTDGLERPLRGLGAGGSRGPQGLWFGTSVVDARVSPLEVRAVGVKTPGQPVPVDVPVTPSEASLVHVEPAEGFNTPRSLYVLTGDSGTAVQEGDVIHPLMLEIWRDEIRLRTWAPDGHWGPRDWALVDDAGREFIGEPGVGSSRTGYGSFMTYVFRPGVAPDALRVTLRSGKLSVRVALR